MSGFQTSVNTQPAIGVEGDFASANPRFSVIAGAGALVAGALGLTVGRFAWATYTSVDSEGGPAVVNNTGIGPVTGFVHREQQGLITQYLQESSMLVPAGFPVTLMNGGDFIVKNNGANEAAIGMKAFANLADGKVSFAAAGTIPGGASGATSAVVKTALSVTGSISGNILTVTAVGSGSVYNGTVLDSNGAGTVLKQLTGTPKGIGTYLLDTDEQDVAAGTTIGGHYGVITFGTVTGGPFAVGMSLSGAGVAANTFITDDITGGATSGTMVVNPNTAVSSTTIVGSTAIETKWYAMSPGLAGELIKISDHPLG